ncbi:MAG TPA: NF038122 family metalloprotease [Fimbriimonadaceae bacterium]|nr:NF038122 family metalloprotease [Fimbriimonadaceae bacterium]
MNIRKRFLVVPLVALACVASANLTIIPTFDSTITSKGNAAQLEAAINSVCSLYNATFADNITVNLTFKDMPSGLGQSVTAIGTVSYTNFRNALQADATTADDATALAHLPVQTNNPVNGTTSVVLSSANARALGFAASVSTDSTISINSSSCFLDHNNPIAGKVDYFAVACHEVDEALGTISGVGGTDPFSADMYRYDGSGGRSFTTNTLTSAFFSLDSTTNIVEYNQHGRTTGDWGDWIIHSPNPQVQDWAGTSGVKIDLGPSETRLLDAVGYDFLNPVPEPGSLAVLSLGLLALLRRRKARRA